MRLNQWLKYLRYTGKMAPLFVLQHSVPHVMQFHVKGTPCTTSTHLQTNHDQGCESPSFNTFSLFSSSFLRVRNTTQSIQHWGMETGLAFWSWFNLAVTPIADALKWLGRIVSAWGDLQLGGTSAPAALPRHPFNLRIWHSPRALRLVGSQDKQFPLNNCE